MLDSVRINIIERKQEVLCQTCLSVTYTSILRSQELLRNSNSITCFFAESNEFILVALATYEVMSTELTSLKSLISRSNYCSVTLPSDIKTDKQYVNSLELT